MSNVNIKGAVDNIRSLTTIYTPIVETIVNGIEAIEAKAPEEGGRIAVRAIRSKQLDALDVRPDIIGFEIEDDGIGFTNANRESFDEIYSAYKARQGGKGFGRFVCLKYFDELHVDSVYEHDGKFRRRQFSMGKEHTIVVNEKVSDADTTHSGSVIKLEGLKQRIEKTLPIIGRNIVEKLLPYFITSDYQCPRITLSETDGAEPIVLNEYVTNELKSEVVEVPVENNKFTLNSNGIDQNFVVRVFRFYSPKNQKSKVSLVAHKREVSGSHLYDYIPEFADEFYESEPSSRNYIVRAYVFSPFLDTTVSLERGDFRFQKSDDLEYGISQEQIEERAAQIAKDAIGLEITTRQDRKRDRVQSYVDNDAPWNKVALAEADLSSMPLNPTDEQIEQHLQAVKFRQEVRIRRQVISVLQDTNITEVAKSVPTIVSAVSESSKSELIHYIALRKAILELFKRSLEVDSDGSYSSEGMVHDIIFPRKGDTETTPFDKHNLWIVDERLNFTLYLSSDIPYDQRQGERPDLLAYNHRVSFRGENEATNPVTVFEFKRPQRDDFCDPAKAEKEDPIAQIVRYINAIRDQKYRTPEGRTMLIADNTPFYGYVVCDLTPKVSKWLRTEKNFTPMPDALGWFHWFGNINLYMEVLSWDKVLRDANMRNKIFFSKLGI
jgi:hypothetical protein